MTNRLNAKQLISCLALGVLSALVFAPWSYYWLIPLTFSGLFAMQHQATPKQATWLGFVFGLGFFGIGISWVFISISRFGTQDNLLAGLLTGSLIGYCALYPALAGYLTRLAATSVAWWLAPLVWWLTEQLRSIALTGFPWLVLGTSQTDSPLAPLAAYIGATGLSALLLLMASLLSQCWLQAKRRRYWLASMALIVLSLVASINLRRPALMPQLNLSIVQANIPQSLKWQPGKVEKIVGQHLELTDWQHRLIIWPEGALPGVVNRHPKLVEKITRLAQQHHSTLLFGTITQQAGGFYNTLLAVGQDSGYYTKRHLVPFGEYTPLESLLAPLERRLNIPQSMLIAGNLDQPLLKVDGLTIAPFICYEIAYPSLVKRSAKQADMLLVITDDSWFGQSIASAQHLQIARMRAIESNKPLIFSSNTGPSALIDGNGRILQQSTAYQIDKLKITS